MLNSRTYVKSSHPYAYCEERFGMSDPVIEIAESQINYIEVERDQFKLYGTDQYNRNQIYKKALEIIRMVGDANSMDIAAHALEQVEGM